MRLGWWRISARKWWLHAFHHGFAREDLSSLNFHHPFLDFFVAVDASEAPFGCEHGGGRCDDKIWQAGLPPNGTFTTKVWECTTNRIWRSNYRHKTQQKWHLDKKKKRGCGMPFFPLSRRIWDLVWCISQLGTRHGRKVVSLWSFCNIAMEDYGISLTGPFDIVMSAMLYYQNVRSCREKSISWGRTKSPWRKKNGHQEMIINPTRMGMDAIPSAYIFNTCPDLFQYRVYLIYFTSSFWGLV